MKLVGLVLALTLFAPSLMFAAEEAIPNKRLAPEPCALPMVAQGPLPEQLRGCCSAAPGMEASAAAWATASCAAIPGSAPRVPATDQTPSRPSSSGRRTDMLKTLLSLLVGLMPLANSALPAV